MAKRAKQADDPAGPSLCPARTRVIYCGDNLEQLKKLPGGSVDLITIDPPFHSNRNDEVFWGETTEKRAFEYRHESTQATIEFMRPRAVELARVRKNTGLSTYTTTPFRRRSNGNGKTTNSLRGRTREAGSVTPVCVRAGGSSEDWAKHGPFD
jgi:hypothetical protein